VGRPHNGPDTADNVLCLCPNDHVRARPRDHCSGFQLGGCRACIRKGAR
jgi:hypothetical protein